MDSKNLTVRSEERFDVESVAIISAAVLIIGGVYWLLKKILIEDGLPDPPPIIIKSGTLTLETDQPLTELPGSVNIYKRGFGEIVGVKVYTTDVTGHRSSCSIEEPTGIQVDISLRKYTIPRGWVNVNSPVTIRTGGNPKFLMLKIGKKFKRKVGHPNPYYLEKWVDDEPDEFQIGRVVVKSSGYVRTFNAGNNETLDVGFYY